MAVAISVPRVNNNDDEVKLVEFMVQPGDAVKRGQVIAAVETDKAVVDVESPDDGFFIPGKAECGTMVTVGTTLAWLGASADETAPLQAAAAAGSDAGFQSAEPTAKARALLLQHGLQAADVRPAAGGRLTAEDVERHVAQRAAGGSGGSGTSGHASSAQSRAAPEPQVAGERRALRSDQRGMLATVTWHRDHAVPGYIEIGFDAAPWEARAAAFQQQHGLLLNPLLPLLAWRLVELAQAHPALNATIAGNQRHEYSGVNLGFTVQAGEVLYLAVTHDAQAMGELAFVQQLVDLQRRAAGHKLTAAETQGSTIGFSSMARWKVTRHIPILAPLTAIMVAHTQDHQGQSVLGATYDHRVLHGADVVTFLRRMAKAPSPTSTA